MMHTASPLMRDTGYRLPPMAESAWSQTNLDATPRAYPTAYPMNSHYQHLQPSHDYVAMDHGTPAGPIADHYRHNYDQHAALTMSIQHGDRASPRIAASASLQSSAPTATDYPSERTDSYASRKRSFSSEASAPHHPWGPKKRQKSQDLAGPRRPAVRKGGESSSQIERARPTSAKLAGFQGKEQAVDDSYPPRSLDSESFVTELQTSRCMSTRLKVESVSRCLSCTRRWAGDTCRFQGIRYLLWGPDRHIVAVTFINEDRSKITQKAVTFPTQWNVPLLETHKRTIKLSTARSLLPVLKRELEHIRPADQTIHRMRETDCRATCDTCMTSTFSETWMCRTCGREACRDCFERIASLTGASQDRAAASKIERERLLDQHPTFLNCLSRKDHDWSTFLRVTRFDKCELEEAIKEMTRVLEEVDREKEQQLVEDAGTPDLCPGSASTTESSGIRTPTDPNSFDRSSISSLSTSSEEEEREPGSFDIPRLPIPRYPIDSISDSRFGGLWEAGQPILIHGLLDRFNIQWTPEYFIKNHGDTSVRILECQKNHDAGVKDVSEFFAMYGNYEGRDENVVLKVKDWPPSADFQAIFPDLYRDFSQAVPFPDYVRRDGVLNVSSHFPTDVLGPDLGPKMYNALATHTGPGSQGSTRLHMDMADALNIMTFASNKPDGTPGCAAWDLYRREDTRRLRTFMREQLGFSKSQNAGHDPIHSQLYYLSDDLRDKLYRKYGVKSYRVYQYPGDAIMIPAGCAHQVANLSDCIKVAIDYVSPQNIDACALLTKEFREQNVRTAWKEDVLQLRSMMWYAWQSCCRTDMQQTEGTT